MKMKQTKKMFSLFLCIVLIAAMALFTTGCNEKTIENPTEAPDVTVSDVTLSDLSDESVSEIGDGETSFVFTVTGSDGNESKFIINTDKTVVGDALLELGLIEGEEGPYGLYVKTVNGETADYDVNGKYWAFYVNGDYALSGVDTTEITEGVTYSFKVE